VPKEIVTIHKCDYPGCSYVSNRLQSLSGHKMYCHNQEKSYDTATMECDITSVTTVTSEKFLHKCDYPSCNYISNTSKSLSMHKTRCHKKRKSLISSTVGKQSVNLSHNLYELSSKNFTRESDMASVVSDIVRTNEEPNITGCVFSDVEPDDKSLASMRVHW